MSAGQIVRRSKVSTQSVHRDVISSQLGNNWELFVDFLKIQIAKTGEEGQGKREEIKPGTPPPPLLPGVKHIPYQKA